MQELLGPLPVDENGKPFFWSKSKWAWRLDQVVKKAGLAHAQCMRQLAWDYRNEKTAQIYAEQCTSEPYDCITEYKEDFPQMMNIFTEEGVHDGKKAMKMAFERWMSTNKSMMQVAPGPNGDRQYFANRLNDYDYTDKEQSKYLDWANLVFWRTFLLGCGKAHFHENGKDWTRIVCIYGPGVNYIPRLKELLANDPSAEPENPAVLYDEKNIPCFPGDPFQPDFPASCPFFKCDCRFPLTDFFLDVESSWPWLCANDCLADLKREGPIPAYLDYLNGSTDRRMKPLLSLLLGAVNLLP